MNTSGYIVKIQSKTHTVAYCASTLRDAKVKARELLTSEASESIFITRPLHKITAHTLKRYGKLNYAIIESLQDDGSVGSQSIRIEYHATMPKFYTGRPYFTLSEIQADNAMMGYYFFDLDTMRFFRSRVSNKVYSGRYFITSEQFNDQAPRRYTIRAINESGEIDTIGNFQQYSTLAQAKAAVKTIK